MTSDVVSTRVELGPRNGTTEWPDDVLDAAELERLRWSPIPIRQFLLKVFTRCNLNCDYCYVYEHADQSWRTKPKVMSDEVVVATAGRIAEHAADHDLDEIRVVFHGGEPLLAGREFLERSMSTIRGAMAEPVRLSFGMQSNAVRIDEATAQWCADHRLSVGVSLDGDRIANDRHRRYRNGASSYDQVLSGVRNLQRHPGVFTGLLCTIDLANDPVQTYDEFLSLGPPAVDFLLPHGNWTTPPPDRRDDPSTPYANWLIAIFDRWFDAPRKEVRIRFFEEIINLLLGGASHVETVGLTPATLVVIETSGEIEQVDALKSAFDGAASTGTTVFDTSFDEVLRQPGVAARQLGSASLCTTCSGCEIGAVCGGGYYPHRYRAGSGFLNPSVYCQDLYRLIKHIDDRLHTGLAAAMSGSADVSAC